MGGKSGPTMDSSDFVEEPCAPSQPSKPTKTIQGGSSSWSGSEAGKTIVGNGGADSCQVVFMKDDVSVNPARDARERISGLLRLTKQGSSLLMTWTPTPLDSGGRCASTVMDSTEQDRDLRAIRSVSLAEMRSIRRHTPPVGLQYIIIVLMSGLSLPPLYFHTGGVKEFFAKLRNHALLVRSIDDPSVYFVSNIDDSFQIQEKVNETNEEENKEKEKEKKLEQEESEIEKKVSEEAANSVGTRRSGLELVYYTQENGTPALMLERAPPRLRWPPPLNFKEGATFLDDEVQILDSKPFTLPDITYIHPPPFMEDILKRDTPSRKRTYRRSPDVLPTLPPADNLSLVFTPGTDVRNRPSKRHRRSLKEPPSLPPAENITLQFTPIFTPRFRPVTGKQSRKTVDLVLPPAEKASSIPVDRRYRRTFDLVLSPDATRGNVAPVIPHTSPNFVGSSTVPGQSLPPDDAVPSNASQGVGHFFSLYCSGSFREGVSLPVSWRSRLHLAEMSSEGGALARRRREWWLGTSLSASVATGIPNHVINLLFTSELFSRLMVDSGLTYKALNALKYIDKFGIVKHVTSGDICQYLKTFFSKAIWNRQRWQRMGGVVVDNSQPLATSMILPYGKRPGVTQRNNVQPPHEQSGVSQENRDRVCSREKPVRRWVQRSARVALRKVFEYWGYRECTPDETLALSAQFQGNPTPMQIMQLFRNWGQEKRRQDRDPDNLPRSHQPRRKDILQAQPALGPRGSQRKPTEAASEAQDAQQPLPRVKKRPVLRAQQDAEQPLRRSKKRSMLGAQDAEQPLPPDKKRPVLGEVSGSTSLQSESQPSGKEETAFKVDPRGVLRQVFEEKGCRMITLGEAFALSIGFQGNPSATQVQQLFGEWAQDWQHRQAQQTKLLEDSARQAEDARHARHAYLYRKKLPVKKLPIKRLPVVSTVPGCNSLQSETQPTSTIDTTPTPPVMEESKQLVTERQALLRMRLLEESARQVEAARQACGYTMKPPLPLSVSGCSSPQVESQSTGMEVTPAGSLASRGGRRQSRARGVFLPVTQ